MERFRNLGKHDVAHKAGVWALASTTSRNCDLIGDFVTGGCDGNLKTWRIKSYNDQAEESDVAYSPLVQVATFSGHSLPIVGVAVAENGSMGLSSSMDGFVRVWNFGNSQADSKAIQQVNVAEMWGVDIGKDGRKGVTGGVNGVVKVLDIERAIVDETYSIAGSGERKGGAMVLSVAFNGDGSKVAAGGHDGRVTVLDVETGKVVGDKLAKHGGPVRTVCYLPGEGDMLVTGSDDHLIRVYDVGSGQVTASFKGHKGMVFNAKGSEDRKYLISGASDRCLNVWDRVSKEAVYSFKGHSDSVWGVCYAKEGKHVVSASDDGGINVLDCSNADIVV